MTTWADDLARIDVDLRAMYLDMLADTDLVEAFVELEDHLSDPDQCDHGNLGADGCSVDQLRRIAEAVGVRLAARNAPTRVEWATRVHARIVQPRWPSPVVQVGSVWADNDPRSTGRHIRVVAVDATHATVELVDQRGRPARGHENAQRAEPGRQTRIRLDRFRPTSTGYRLVSEGV